MTALLIDRAKVREFNYKSEISCETIKIETYLTAYNLI